MIKITSNTKTVYRKEEDEAGAYSMPIVDYSRKVTVFGIPVFKRVILDDISLEEVYESGKKQNKPGF